MENILEVYTRPCDPGRPPVCMDEVSKQPIAETRCPRPIQPGRPARYDDEYERRGTMNLFLRCRPLPGRRHVTVTQRRTKVDWAQVIRIWSTSPPQPPPRRGEGAKAPSPEG